MQLPVKKIVFSMVGIIVLVIISYFIYQNIVYVTTDNAQIEGHAVLLAPKESGFITKVNVEQGQKVKKNEILIEIDERDYQNSLKQSKANLISLTAKLSDAEINFKRTEKLFKIGAATQQQYDSNLANYSDIKAQSDSATAQVLQAELMLEYTKIKAPSNGIIAKKSAEIGQFANPGVPLIGFVDTDERWVTANFKETEIEYVKNGERAFIDVDAISNKTYYGTVFAMSSATGATFTLLPPDNATGNFTKVVQRVPVKIKFDKLSENDIELLKNGLSVIVKVRKSRDSL
jgi:membrane fusion protein, multidrug efflux system